MFENLSRYPEGRHYQLRDLEWLMVWSNLNQIQNLHGKEWKNNCKLLEELQICPNELEKFL